MKKRTKEQIFKAYITLVDFFADFLGEDYEILLHDIENVDESIVYIKNNFSGRKIGGPITDLGLRVLKEKKYVDEKFLVNYKSKTNDGKLLRSATYFIDDDNGKLIAMLCINYDATKVEVFREFLDQLIMGEKISDIEENEINCIDKHVSENLFDSVEDIAYQLMNDVISRYGVAVARMTLDEKKEIIAEVEKKGFFLVKGSVKTIANKLEISETTVYRIINSSQNS